MITSIGFKEYRQLCVTDQETLLWKYASQLLQHNEEMHTFILYQLNAFYIEVIYSVPLNSIVTILAFEDLDRLDKYLEQINIDTLRFKL